MGAGRSWWKSGLRLKMGVVLVGVTIILLSSGVGAVGDLGVGRCKPGAPIQVVAFGDSLTAGFGLAQNASFPAQLEKVLNGDSRRVVVVNAGVSGDTTGAGLARFNWAIAPDTDAVILELGANDMLRGISPALAYVALDKILMRLKARKIAVLLAGIPSVSNWGKAYEAEFNPIFSELAAKHGTLLYPHFLDGVAGEPALNQPDGLHPTREGIAVIVKRILPKTEALLLRAKAICADAASRPESSP